MAEHVLWLLIIPAVMFIRNNWVYKKRMKLIRYEDGILIINQYLSYDQMMYRFWVWNIEKLRKPTENC